MSDNEQRDTFDDIENRRTFGGRRRLSFGRRVYYALGTPLLLCLIRLLWWSYRVERVIGVEHAERLLAEGRVIAPCYWHQYTLVVLRLMRLWIRRGFRAGFIITPSVDGEVPARIARAWGAVAIRGSANKTGALALRDMHTVMKRGVSIVTAADGPLGPKEEFKLGVVLMARIGDAPIVPLACAADRAWTLRRWDDFMIPKPFARVVYAIGEPYEIPAGGSMEDIERHRRNVESAVNSLTERSKEALSGTREADRHAA